MFQPNVFDLNCVKIMLLSCRSASIWLKITPFGLRKMLNFIKDKFNNPEILITENGYSDKEGYLDDAMRVFYYKYYINNVLKGNPSSLSLFNCFV